MSDDFIILNSEIPGAPRSLGKQVWEYLPETIGNGRQLQILVRMQGSRPDKPHDNWYVIQIVKQTHRGMDFAHRNGGHFSSQGDTFTSYKDGVKVVMRSGTDAESSTPRVWTNSSKVVCFNVWNAFGKLDNIPMIIDEREYKAIRAAVEAYNEEHRTKNTMRPSNILPERPE